MHWLETLLLVSMSMATAIAFYMTVLRLLTRKRYISYDAWIFAMCFAVTLQIYDSHFR